MTIIKNIKPFFYYFLLLNVTVPLLLPLHSLKPTLFNYLILKIMKTLLKISTLWFAVLFMATGLFTIANASNNPNNLLLPVEKKGKYAKLDVSSLPLDQEVTIRVRDDAERLVDEFKVTNRGQSHVLVNFNRLKPGIYSMNILRGENDVVRKILNIHWNQVNVNNVMALSRDIGQENRWPLFLIR